MVPAIRLATLALTLALVAVPVTAAPQNLNNLSIYATVSLGCAIDYSDPNQTRFIITNTSGHTVVKGSKITWTTMTGGKSFYLPHALAAREVFSFPMKSKGQDCTVKATPPVPVMSPN
jgi:hypothetical protein